MAGEKVTPSSYTQHEFMSLGERLYLNHSMYEAEMHLLKESKDERNLRSKLVLAMMYYSIMPDKLHEAYAMFENISKADVPEYRWCSVIATARMAIQNFNKRGYEVDADPEEAYRLAGSAYEDGLLDSADVKDDWLAQCTAGYLYQKDLINRYGDSQIEAKRWYERAATQGCTTAQYNLGVLYENNGEGDKVDYEKAIFWYKRAADEANCPDASRTLYRLVCGFARRCEILTEQEGWEYALKAAHAGDEFCVKACISLLSGIGAEVPHFSYHQYSLGEALVLAVNNNRDKEANTIAKYLESRSMCKIRASSD